MNSLRLIVASGVSFRRDGARSRRPDASTNGNADSARGNAGASDLKVESVCSNIDMVSVAVAIAALTG
jgi:hypothetical protein